jgi:hypothetical protein
MTKRWAARGFGRRGAAPLMPPRWLRVLPSVLASWSERLPVGYGVTGSGGRPGTRDRVRGRNTAAGPCGGAASGAIWEAPPPLCLPVEPTVESATSASMRSAEFRRHGHCLVPATRKRVVLLPHVRITPTDIASHDRRAPEGPPG